MTDFKTEKKVVETKGTEEDTKESKGSLPDNTNLGLQMTGLQTEEGKIAQTPEEIGQAREDIRTKELAVQKKEAEERAAKVKKLAEEKK
jgi:hypothetical protein